MALLRHGYHKQYVMLTYLEKSPTDWVSIGTESDIPANQVAKHSQRKLFHVFGLDLALIPSASVHIASIIHSFIHPSIICCLNPCSHIFIHATSGGRRP